MTITCVEQARIVIELGTLPYTVNAPFGVLNYKQANNFAYAVDGPMLQYGCSETGPIFNPVSIPSMTVQFLGQTAAVETDYGTAPGSDDQIDTNVIFWGCRAAWSTTGAVGPTIHVYCYDVAFDAGKSLPAIAYVNEVIPNNSNPTGTGASAFLWQGLTDPFLVATTFDHVNSGPVDGVLYDGAAVFTTANGIVTFPAVVGHYHFEPDLIKPDPDNNQNLFYSRQSVDLLANPQLAFVAKATPVGLTTFSDTLTFSASDINAIFITNALAQSWEVRPDGWYAWSIAPGSFTSPPANVSIGLIRISNDFTKYWVYFFTWKPGDATAQNIIQNVDVVQLLWDVTYVYYQDIDFPGTILSAVFTVPPGAPPMLAPPSACSPKKKIADRRPPQIRPYGFWQPLNTAQGIG